MNYTYIFLTCNTDLHNFRIKKKESRLRGGGGWGKPILGGGKPDLGGGDRPPQQAQMTSLPQLGPEIRSSGESYQVASP